MCLFSEVIFVCNYVMSLGSLQPNDNSYKPFKSSLAIIWLQDTLTRSSVIFVYPSYIMAAGFCKMFCSLYCVVSIVG